MLVSALPIIFMLSAAGDQAAINVQMGDGQVDGSKIKPYEFTWSQCSLKDGQWQAGNPLTEKLSKIGNHVLRIEQSGELPGGVKNNVAYFVDRKTLAPILTERSFKASDGKLLANQQWMFDENGYHAKIFQQGKNQEKTGTLSSKMYNAMTLGMPLSTLDFERGEYALKAFMTNFDGSYQLVASKTGSETISHEGQDVSLDWIDVRWLHEQTGDVYPPGPNSSGGRYWISRGDGDKIPRVVRYQTDSYAIEFLPGVCPAE